MLPQDYGGLEFSGAFGKIIFILFIFFIMLVIMNLLNGLAVSDIGEYRTIIKSLIPDD